MKRLPSILVAGLVLSGCAPMAPGEKVAYDPWEKLNRGTYRFNDTIDRATLKPVAKAYRKVVPDPARKGVTNFFRNLETPGSAINNFLQGKPGHGFRELTRFVVNSSIGIGGLFDVAARNGVEAHPEDFGQTAAVWGMPPGPYIVIPFFGPGTLRDAVFLPVDTASNPLYYCDKSTVRDPLLALRIIDLRMRLLSLEKLLKDSKDPYVTIRESYLQNRKFEVYDGNPPDDEDDALFDEFLDEEVD